VSVFVAIATPAIPARRAIRRSYGDALARQRGAICVLTCIMVIAAPVSCVEAINQLFGNPCRGSEILLFIRVTAASASQPMLLVIMMLGGIILSDYFYRAITFVPYCEDRRSIRRNTPVAPVCYNVVDRPLPVYYPWA
jgi:hypothetical protein